MVHLFVRSSVLLLAALAVQACSSSDSSTSSSGGTSGTAQSSSGTSGTTSSGGGGGTCTGDIANCPLGTLSSAQQNDMCSILDAAIDDPPGTKLACPSPDQFLVVNSKEQCVAQPAKASCKVTVTQLVGCFTAAKKNACAAFATGGACAPLFDPSTGCLD